MNNLEKQQLDRWIERGESKGTSATLHAVTTRRANEKAQRTANREARERRAREEYAKREAERTHIAQRRRYVHHILHTMPVMDDVQRMPAPAEFVKRVSDAFDTIRHIDATSRDANDAWQDAVIEVSEILTRNQHNAAMRYAEKMRRAIAAGESNLSAIWESIAHHADKNDRFFKLLIWDYLKK